jgi:hypothetical protein
MGEWKTQMSLRVSQQFREDWEKWAAKERRVPGTMGCIVLEWAFEQLKIAGSVTNLLTYTLGKKPVPKP